MFKSFSMPIFVIDAILVALLGALLLHSFVETTAALGLSFLCLAVAVFTVISGDIKNNRRPRVIFGTITILSAVVSVIIGIAIGGMIGFVGNGMEGYRADYTTPSIFCAVITILIWCGFHWRFVLGLWGIKDE